MDCIEYGNPKGKPVIYFHGAPGAIEEASVFEPYASQHNLRILSFDRFSLNSTLYGNSYYQAIAHAINNKIHSNRVSIIGFSIGTHVALETARLLGSQVDHIHLISAAAPINTAQAISRTSNTSFDLMINHMAGGFVFKLALNRPTLFKLLTGYQTLLAKLAPSLLVSMLFASAQGEDKTLSQSTRFRKFITPILKRCFTASAPGYLRDIDQYVNWPKELGPYSPHVSLWHGDCDNWSPPAMATNLYDELPSAVNLELRKGGSHYSCLLENAERICAQLDESDS